MKSQTRPNGIVFVSYARRDLDRVKPLVDELAERFNIFMDRLSLVPGEPWRQGLTEGLERARCVLGLFTKDLSLEGFALEEMDWAQERGIFLPVKLDPIDELPLGFRRIQHLDLSLWNGGAEPLSDLFVHIQAFLERPRPDVSSSKPDGNSAPPDINWAISNSSFAVASLRGVADQVATVGGVLVNQAGPVEDVKASLKEIHATCAAALEAIDRFLEPMKRANKVLLNSYLKIPGVIRQIVQDKKGHCTRILEYYYRVGGLRDWLLEHAKPEVVDQADGAFGCLASADGDLFASITQIGEMLDDEATYIRALLLRGEESEARKRLNEAQLKLLPLRSQLTEFIGEFSNVKSQLGYVKTV